MERSARLALIAHAASTARDQLAQVTHMREMARGANKILLAGQAKPESDQINRAADMLEAMATKEEDKLIEHVKMLILSKDKNRRPPPELAAEPGAPGPEAAPANTTAAALAGAAGNAGA